MLGWSVRADRTGASIVTGDRPKSGDAAMSVDRGQSASDSRRPAADPFPRDTFLGLPRYGDEDPDARKVGVEIEFAGLTEEAAAALIIDTLGGELRSERSFHATVSGSALGDLAIDLDTRFAKDPVGPMVEAGLDISRGVIPVEIVTEPLSQADLPRLEELRRNLKAAGALGSRSGLLRGFGVHLNVQVADHGERDATPVTRAFALIEDWLREADPMDNSRRIMPFVDPYDTEFVDRLAGGRGMSRDDLFGLYLSQSVTRNRGLDLLPLIAAVAPDHLSRIAASEGAVSGRPAWHYRLPDCRIDEDDWSLAYEWNRWVLVERIAADAELLDRLAALWLERREDLTAIRALWWRAVDEVIGDKIAGILAR